MTILVLTILLLSAISPALQSPGRDSGVFLYTGWRMLQGDRLYSELWDHKPPLIYAIQMAGLVLGDGGQWGIWILQVLFITLAYFLAWRALSTVLESRYAGLVTAASLIVLYRVLTGGNSTETYALLPQMGILYLLLKHEDQIRFGDAVSIGILTGVAFNLRQNLFGVGLAAALMILLWRPSRSRIAKSSAVLVGFFLVCGLVILPFTLNGTLKQFWAAVFTYNFHYAGLQFSQRLVAIGDTLQFMQADPFFAVALLGWFGFSVVQIIVTGQKHQDLFQDKRYATVGFLFGAALMTGALLGDMLRGQPFLHDFGSLQVILLVLGAGMAGLAWLWRSGRLARLFSHQEPWSLPRSQRQLMSLIVLWLPIEVVLAAWSGRDFLHYYIALVPVSLVILSLVIHYIARTRQGALWVVLLFFLVLAKPIDLWVDDLRLRHESQLLVTAQYLEAHSDPNEAVWVWGAEPAVNFYAQLRQPTRFSYLYPLFQFHEGAAAMSVELWDDIVEQPPRLIIDTRDSQTPFPLHPEAEGCVLPEIHLQGKLEAFFYWVCEHYQFSHFIGPEQWPVYRYQHP